MLPIPLSPRERRQARLTVAAALLVLVAVLIFGVLATSRIRESEAMWQAYTHRIHAISGGLARIQQDIGYGGFIHHFKNLVLRRDVAAHAPEIERTLADLKLELDRLRDVLILPENRARVDLIRSVFVTYEQRYRLALEMIAAGRSVEEIDAAVHLDEQVVRDALVAMIDRAGELTRDAEDDAHQAHEQARLFIQAGGSLILIALGAATWILLRQIRRLALARAEAERANAAKDEFLSRMSHELRTPLNAILGFSQLLSMPDKTPLSAQQADNVREIYQAGEHLLGLVNEVLDLARIESGRLELSPEALPLADRVEHCVAEVRPLAEAANIGIETCVAADCTVWGDAARTTQVLLNLLSNAVKYNREGGHIAVKTRRQGETWRIEVADTGRGIAADKLGKLFQPFERLESSYDGIEGAGVGLALVKRLVEAMGGTVGVESQAGAGSLFWFALPAVEKSLRTGGVRG